MTLKTLTFALATAGIAANIYARMRRNQMRAGGDNLSSKSGGLPNTASRGTGLSGSDSQDLADRFQESSMRTASTGLGTSSAIGNGTASGGLTSSSTQRESSLAEPGLPDFTRGA